jgi:transposase
MERRRVAMGKRARFYAKQSNGAATWKVMDRLTGVTAYFAVDGAKKPAILDGIVTKYDALKRIAALEEYFNGIGLPCHSRKSERRFDGPLAANPRPAALAASIIGDDLWRCLQSVLPDKPLKTRGSRRAVDDRAALAGIVHALRHKLAWRDIPHNVGCSGQTCATRLREWQSSGAWKQVRDVLSEHLPDAACLDWERLTSDPLVGGQLRLALLRRIDAFLADTGVSDRRLGVIAFQSETFLHLMRKGKWIRKSTYAQVVQYLDDAERTDSAARKRLAARPEGPHALVSDSERKALLARIEHHLVENNMLPSNFGKLAFNNPSIVHRLRMARGVTERVRDRIDEYIRSAPSTQTIIESDNDNSSIYSYPESSTG